MGLSTVELIMAVEDEFGIELAEADAAKLAVLGEMHAHIVQAIRQRGESPNETDVWERLKAIGVEQLGVHPAEVTRAAHLVNDLGAD